MARFSFNLRTLSHVGVNPVIAQHALVALQQADARDAALGPGWFDSSWDLGCGLQVHEGLPPDAEVDEWIENALLTGFGDDPIDAFAEFGIGTLELVEFPSR